MGVSRFHYPYRIHRIHKNHYNNLLYNLPYV
ncbi:hypothetical protein [Staphylococcus phage vB_SauM-V1SA12]|nr:hypothetical protein [Staphylococcus phage vB_SauM-V1SA12]